MKTRILIVIFLVIATMSIMATAVMAHDDPVPPSYAGLKNPFPWNDAGAQAQGKAIYTKACSACHGLNGGSLPAANFAAADFPARLEAQPDHYFWMVSEGALSSGMPPFKSSLSEEQRWQVVTYLWSLNKVSSSTPTATPAAPPGSRLTLNFAEQTHSPSLLMITAYLSEANGKPVGDQTIKFYLKKDFFATDWIQIGELQTDKLGMATLDYPPREDGDIQVKVLQGTLENIGTWTLKSKSKPYQAEAGIRMPTLGPDISVGGTQEALGPVDMTDSPTGGIRMPGGILSWLLVFVGVVLLVWATYFRVMREVLGIAGDAGQAEQHSVRLVPMVGLMFVFLMGLVLALMILHGPYTHLSLLR